MREMTIEQLKACQLGIMSEIHNFCDKNGLKYSLWGGSLIGAARHNGYIPWDDDMDICMLRKDYEFFIKNFNSDMYGVANCDDNALYPYPFAKAFDKTTKKVESIYLSENYEIGVDVDIFPIDELEDSNRLTKKIIRKRNRLIRLRLFSLFLKNERGLKGFLKRILAIVYNGKANKYSKKLNSDAKAFALKRFNRYMLYADPNIKTPLLIDKSIFEGYQLHKFENKEYYIVNEYDKLLTLCFGNWRKFPPENQRVTHHSFVAFQK